ASCSMTGASMPMIERIASPLGKKLERLRGAPRDPARGDGAIVPKDSIAGNALAAVVAIMTFLAAVTSGGVAMVIGSATEWQSEIAREMTIQIRPAPGRDIETDVGRAEAIAR